MPNTKTEKSAIYSPDYPGRRWWLLGIKVDEKRDIIPFHNAAFGGVPWQQGTQNQIMDDGWLGLDRHRMRLTRQLLYASQITKAVSEIQQKVVRWQADKRSQILSLEHRIKTYDKKKEKFVAAGYLYHAGSNDIPVSKYLVFLPRTGMEEFSDSGKLYEPNLNSLPSMLDLDPSLIPDRMSGRQEGVSVEDEAW